MLSLREVDIVVVGLGPAGSAFSYFTSKSSNADIICFERNTRLALKPCGELVPKELFSIIGVNPREVNAYPIRRVIVYFYHNGSLVERVIEFNGVEGYSISKRRLLEILVDKALSSGVSVELGKPVLRISRDGVVNVREVGIVRGKYVICCDGVYGVSVEYFKPGRVAKAYQRRVANVKTPYDEACYTFIIGGVKGYGWIIPKSDGTLNIGFGGLDIDPRVLLDKMVKTIPWLSSYSVVCEGGALIPVSGLRSNIVESKLIALGDVAGSVLPLSGEGIRPSIIMAKYLSRAVIEALEEGDKRLWEGIRRYISEWGYRIKRSLLYLKVYERMPIQLVKQLVLRVKPDTLKSILNGEFTGAIVKFG